MHDSRELLVRCLAHIASMRSEAAAQLVGEIVDHLKAPPPEVVDAAIQRHTDEVAAWQAMQACNLCRGAGPFSSCVHYLEFTKALRSSASALYSLAERCRPAVAHDARLRERDVDSDKYAPSYRPTLKAAAERAAKLLDDIDAILAGKAPQSAARVITR